MKLLERFLKLSKDLEHETGDCSLVTCALHSMSASC